MRKKRKSAAAPRRPRDVAALPVATFAGAMGVVSPGVSKFHIGRLVARPVGTSEKPAGGFARRQGEAQGSRQAGS